MHFSQDVILIQVHAGHSGDEAVHEELPAMETAPGVFRLLSSPGLALNLAKGDLVARPVPGRPAEVLERGGNFCVHVYADHVETAELDELERDVQSELKGSLDGVFEGNLSLSVPASHGLEAIRAFFDRYTERTGKPWFFANIYKNFSDLEDDTLLDWWVPGAS